MANLIEVVQVLNVLYIAYPKHTSRLSDLQIEQVNALYARMLADVDAPLLKAASEQHIAESEWFPTVAELRNRAVGLTRLARHIVSAEETWGTVLRAAGALGRDTTTERLQAYFKDWHGAESAALIAQTVKSVGWRDICNCDEDHIGVVRAHFYRTYETFEKRGTVAEKLLPQVRAVVENLTAQFTQHWLPEQRQRRPQLPRRDVQPAPQLECPLDRPLDCQLDLQQVNA